MRKILVLRGGALGDFVVTLPALALVRQRWPDAHIELAGNARAAELARARGLVDAVHSQHEARWSALFDAAKLPAAFAAWLADFDLVVNYWPDPDGDLSRHFPLRAGQLLLSWPAAPATSPAAAHYRLAWRSLGIDGTGPDWHPLAPRAAETGPAGNVFPLVAVHPGSGSPRKNWPLARWAEVIDTLPGSITLVLGEAELERRTPQLEALLANPRVTPAVNLPLEALVARLSRCALFLGHDSGVSHVAAATGIPCLLLFGPTDPAMWAPPAPAVKVLRRGPEVSAIELEDVRTACREMLPAR